MSDSIPINRSLWKKSTYQGHYDEHAEFYEGIRCRCVKCGGSFIFSAVEQRDSFEIDGKFPRWVPTLCQSCNSLLREIEAKEKSYLENWSQREYSIVNRQKILSEWLAVAVEANSYRQKGYEHTIGMIKSVLSEADSGCA